MTWYQIAGFVLIAVGLFGMVYARIRRAKIRREIDDYYMRIAGYRGPKI